MKKKISFISIAFLTFFKINNVYAYEIIKCGEIEIPVDTANLISIFITILQIAVPIILIVMGMLDLLKATISSKEDEIKKGQQTFIRRLIMGAIVFLVILVVKIVVGILPSDQTNGAINCLDRVLNGIASKEERKEKVLENKKTSCINYYFEKNKAPNYYPENLWKQCICELAHLIYEKHNHYEDHPGLSIDEDTICKPEVPKQILENDELLNEFKQYSDLAKKDVYCPGLNHN